ncbi:MAG: DUF2784 domain-containing protein [Thermoguttaceae bacterium]
MLVYRILADLIVVIHAAMAAFVVLGLVAVLIGRLARWRWIRNFWFRSVHLALIAVIVIFPVLGSLCPLTELENWFRQRGGEQVYPGSFIAHWVHELLFVEVSPHLIAVSYCAFGVAVLLAFFVIPPQWPRRKIVPEDRAP